MDGNGSDDLYGHFNASGMVSKNRKVKLFLTYDDGKILYLNGMMKADLKLISGSWGMTAEDSEDIFRLQKSTSGVAGTSFTAPKVEEAKKDPVPTRARGKAGPVQISVQHSVESSEIIEAKKFVASVI